MILKFGYSEKATKFEKIFHINFDVTEYCQILSGRFFHILWPSQNIRTLKDKSTINFLVGHMILMISGKFKTVYSQGTILLSIT